ncbi:AIPR family protein [Arthrobacter sulfonylureivorans]|uniref:AIPR family protein n=1 Tax=Arthrobacter sulfonylureivorans TaxID=2486855 RepID=UPI0039E51EE8
MTETEHETYFSAKQYLRHFNATHDDLLSGMVDGAQDGGIDALYIFVNGFCIRDDTPLKVLGRNAQLDLVILQVKNSKGFGESAIDKLVVNLPRLLDFNRKEENLSKTLNPRVIEITRRFLSVYRALEMPSLRILTCFVALKADHLHPNTLEKSALIADVLHEAFGSCIPQIDFLDASALSDMAREKPSITRSLALAENPISTDTAGGYIGVVRLDEYEKFITDDSGNLDASLFEANVRDYEGETTVNRSIQSTLEKHDENVDFWWLNNGVTIVANRVQPANKLLELESPQIVNGLQTSHEIYKRGRSSATSTETRSVLVKIIQAEDDRIRDRIIRATNSQTSLSPSSLRATDKVQRQIEEYLLEQGLYYERRKHLYSNKGIRLDDLVSIDQMGQALLASLVQAPHVARGQVSRVFEDEVYDLLFAPTHPIAAYLSAIRLQRECEDFLRADESTRGQVEDFCFHLTMLATIAATRKNRPSAVDIAQITEFPSSVELQDLLQLVRKEFADGARRRREVLFDRVAKDADVTSQLLLRGKTYLSTSSRRTVVA